MYTICCDISNYFVKKAQCCYFLRDPSTFSLLQFCQKCSILSFSEKPVWFFPVLQYCQKSWLLSFQKAPYIFFCLFNFVKHAKSCHFQKRPVYYFLVLNFVKNAPLCHFVGGPCIFSRLQFCQNAQFLSFCERTVDIFDSSIWSKMLNFVIFREARVFLSLF